MAYVAPTPEEFLASYPEFEDFEPQQIIDALARGGRNVDDSWFEEDYAPAIMLYAAHLLQFRQNALDTGNGTAAGAIASESLGPISVSYEKSGGDSGVFDPTFLGATAYGIEYSILLRQNRGGPRVV